MTPISKAIAEIRESWEDDDGGPGHTDIARLTAALEVALRALAQYENFPIEVSTIDGVRTERVYQKAIAEIEKIMGENNES